MSDGFGLAKKEVRKQDPPPDPILNSHFPILNSHFSPLRQHRAGRRPAQIAQGSFTFDIAEKKYEKKYENKKYDSYLSLLQQLSAGRRPAQIARNLGIPKTTLQYHLDQLKAAGLITKLGYGVWEVTTNPKQVRKQVRKQDPPQDSIPNLNLSLLRQHRAGQRPAQIAQGSFIFDIAEKKYEKKYENKTPKYDSYLSLLQPLSAGRRPAQIARDLGIPKTTLQYHLDQLKAAGLITKLGYGCWEVNDTAPINPQKRSTKTTHVALDKTPKYEFLGAQDSVRGHAFVFVLKVPPGLLNWNNRRREEYLKRHGIAYQQLGIAGGGQRIWMGGRKVWLTTSSIVIYEKSSFFAATAKDAKHHALFSFIALVKKLERTLHADFTFKLGKEYRFKVSRQHYALVRNALAEQYDHEGKRLQVHEPDAGKLWFVIDNSFNLHEAETVHPRTADSDNAKVQNFFNSLKACPVTTDVLVTAIAGVTQNQVLFAENITNHIQAVRELGQGVREMNQLLAKLEELLYVLASTLTSQAELLQTKR